MNSELLVANGMSRVDGYLAHYGRSVRDGAPVGSGRYHLGSGADPYQMFTRDREEAPRGLAGVVSKLKRHGGGTATAEEKKLLKQQLKIQKAEFKAKTKAAKEEENRRKAAEEAERKAKEEEDRKRAAEEAERQKIEDTKRQIEDRKFQLLRSGDMKQILENQQLFTTQELQGALDRANRLEQMQAKMPKQKSALDKIDAMFGAVGKAANWIDTGAKFAKSIKNMQALMNPDANPQQKMTIGQQYAAKLLAGINGKSLDEIDFNKLGADMKKVNTVNDLYNMAAKGIFKGGGSDGKIINKLNEGNQQNNKKEKQNQNPQNKDQENSRSVEEIKKDTKNAEPVFKDDQPSKKELKAKQRAQEQELKKRESERRASEQEQRKQEKAERAAEQERQRQEDDKKREEQKRLKEEQAKKAAEEKEARKVAKEEQQRQAEIDRYNKAEERRQANIEQIVQRSLERLAQDREYGYGSPAYTANRLYQLANNFYDNNTGSVTLTPTQLANRAYNEANNFHSIDPAYAAQLQYLRDRYGI